MCYQVKGAASCGPVAAGFGSCRCFLDRLGHEAAYIIYVWKHAIIYDVRVSFDGHVVEASNARAAGSGTACARPQFGFLLLMDGICFVVL